MIPSVNRLAPVSGANPALDAMIEEVANRLQAGGEVNLEAIARRDPERADLLRQLLPAIRMMADLGRSIVHDAAHAEPSGSGPEALGVIGDYRIVREIGRGGMGIVYQAEQVSLNRRVALKVLPFATAVDPKQLTRFHIEAQAAAHLHHANIVPVYAVGCERGLNFYAMQFIEGPSLAAVIRELRRRNEAVAEGQPGAAGMASEMAGDLAEGRFDCAGRGSPDPAHSAGRGSPDPAHSAGRESPDPAHSAGRGSPDPAHSAGRGSPDPAHSAGRGSPDPAHSAGRGSPDPAHGPTEGLPTPSRVAPHESHPSRGRAYFRAVAHLGIQAAEALDYAHRMGVVHRDIKPANLLVDLHGNLWITDFGLARMQEGSDLTLTGDLLGTLRYMSPEQALAQRIVVDYRTDVYSLGVTFYELVTLRPAFDGHDRQEVLHQIASEEPRPLRRIDPSIPRELETIVQKAMTKEPSGRYATAQDMAADLRRFLDDKPIRAKRPTLLERATKSARRHQAATVAAFAILVVAVAALSVSTALIARKAKESQRESLIQQIQRLLSTAHAYGWSDVVGELVHKAARLGPDEGHRLQAYAAASLGGLDARLIKKIPIETATLGFDPSGKKLYLCDTNGQAWVWDGSANPIRKIGTAGVGVFAFKPDGTAVQLLSATEDKPAEMELRALGPAKTLRRFRASTGPGPRIGAIRLTPDAAFVAATILTTEDRGFAMVWNGETGAVVRQVEIARPTGLGLAPDGRWLAVGTKDGEVAVWPLPEGAPLPRLTVGRVAISALAFAPDRLRRAQPTRVGDAWLLAVGDVATGLTVFDLGTRSVRSRCRGSIFDVRAVAFSLDGMLLASAGREKPILWDVSAGRPILQLEDVNTATSTVFSPDGKRVAVSSKNAFGTSGGVQIYELENGRGLQTLWSLDAQVEKTIFSSDNRLVAALAQDFRVGIWDRSAGRLLHVLEVPIGNFTDNAGLAFSPDGRRFAFAAGTQGKMWDVATGEVLKSWRLPEGFQDNLAFLDADRLISARVETTDPSVPPYATDSEKYPRVLHIRNLNADVPQILARISDFNVNVFQSELTRDGRSLLIEGLSGPRKAPVRLVKAFDIAGNRELWTFQDTHPELDWASFSLDPTGRLYMRLDPGGPVHLLEFPSRALLESYGKDDARRVVCSLSPGGQLRLSIGHPDETPYRIRLWAPRQETPLLTLADIAMNGGRGCQFSLDGRFAVWGNPDGTVTVFEPEEVQRRLAKFGLGW